MIGSTGLENLHPLSTLKIGNMKMASEMKPKPSEAGVPLLDIDRLLEKLMPVEAMLEYQLGSSLQVVAEDIHEEVGSPNNKVTIRSLLTVLLWMREDTIVEPIK